MDRRKPKSTRPELVPEQLSGVLLRGLRDALRNAPIKKSAYRRLLAMGLIQKNPDRFSKPTPKGLHVLQKLSTRRRQP